MTSSWTEEEIRKIIYQLNEINLPFKGYSFCDIEHGLIRIGSGGYANVYLGTKRKKDKPNCAIKVVGFGEKYVDSNAFRKSVEAQKDLSQFQDGIVKIFDAVELRIWLDENLNIIKTQKVDEFEENANRNDAHLNLQFVVMELLTPVLTFEKNGRPKLYPYRLSIYDKKEILKLAYDIGRALERAHNSNLIHRDIKLENLFYDEKKKQYKLGDFGIAKVTDDGMASTIAFTKGYGAPEVVSALDDKYDNTADIYSYGMMIYLLLNELRFPSSENYNVNVKEQYQVGYVFPSPVYDYRDICGILAGACAYNPDERYQSIEALVNDLDAIMVGENVRYKTEHNSVLLALGSIMLFGGVALWKIMYMPELSIKSSKAGLLLLCIILTKALLIIVKKKHEMISVILLLVGSVLLFFDDFFWWKLLLLIILSLSSDYFCFHFGISVLLIKIIDYLLYNTGAIEYQSLVTYNWIPIVLLLLSMALLFNYEIVNLKDQRFSKICFKYNIYWIAICIFFACLLSYDKCIRIGNTYYLEHFLPDMVFQMMLKTDLFKVGIAGITFCIIWILREVILIRYSNKKIQ